LAAQPGWESPASHLLGILYFQVGKYDEAERAYRRVLELDPAKPSAWSNLGGTLEDLNRPLQAEEAYRRAIELDEHDITWRNLGLLPETQNRNQEAEKAYRRAIELDARSYWAWGSLGDLLARERDRRLEA